MALATGLSTSGQTRERYRVSRVTYGGNGLRAAPERSKAA